MVKLTPHGKHGTNSHGVWLLRDSNALCRVSLLLFSLLNVMIWINLTGQMHLRLGMTPSTPLLRDATSDLMVLDAYLAKPNTTKGDPRDWNEPCVELKAGHLETKYFAKANASNECFTRRKIQEIIVNLVHVTARVFEQNQLAYWLDSGTLLGAVREKTVIPHDNDADFGMDQTAYYRIRDAPLPADRDFPKEYKMVVFNSSFHDDGGRDANIPIRVIDTRNGLYVDVFVFFDEVNEDDAAGTAMLCPKVSWVFWNCERCPTTAGVGKAFRIPRDWVFPLEKCTFANRLVNCPRRSDKYLDYLYGDGYMTPVEYHFD